MPTYQLLTKSKPDDNRINTPSQEYKKLIDSIESLSYDNKKPHYNQFVQLQNVAKAIKQEKEELINQAKENAAKTEQTKPVLSQRERRKFKAESNSPVSKEENKLDLPYEKWVAVLLGAALFTQKQINETNRVYYVKVNRITPPEGTFLTSGSSLYQSINSLNAIANIAAADNKDQAKSFFKRAFFDWYNTTYNNIVVEGEKCASVSTAFNIPELEQAGSDAARKAAEDILTSKFGQLPEISEADHQAFITDKNFDKCTYAKTEANTSNGLVMDIVSGTVNLTTSVVSTGLSYVIPSSFWGVSAKAEVAKPKADAKEDDSVKINTSSLAISSNR